MLVCLAELGYVLAYGKHCDWCPRPWSRFSWVTAGSPLALCSSKHLSVAVAHAVYFICIQMGLLLNTFCISFPFPSHFIRKQQVWLLVQGKVPKEPVHSLGHRASLQAGKSRSTSRDVDPKRGLDVCLGLSSKNYLESKFILVINWFSIVIWQGIFFRVVMDTVNKRIASVGS